MSFFKRLMFAIFSNWSAAFAVGIVSVGAATVIAIMAYAEFQQLKSGKDDARWSVFELGFEYQRFRQRPPGDVALPGMQMACEEGRHDRVAEEARRRHLNPMVAVKDAPQGTAFTVTVDVNHGLTTGISA